MVEMKTLCGATFFVDEDVAEQYGHLAWRLDRDGYVSRKTTVAGKRGRSVRIHRVILGVTDRNIYVDHINMDKLDNTRTNLRVATRAQNVQNRVKQKGRLSEFKGVTKHGEKWTAQINHRYIGIFDDEHEAAHAYNRAAIQLHGEFCPAESGRTSTFKEPSMSDDTTPGLEAEQWKCGNELLPYHPQASHVHPAYRDGWNHCYAAFQAARRAPAPAPQGPTDAEIEALAEKHLWAAAQFAGAGEVWCEGEVAFARAVLARWGAPAASGERGWPKDAADVRLFIEAHCESVQYGRHGPAPHEDDRYTLTAHDLSTAIRWWTDQ